MRLTALTKFSKKDLKPGERIILRVRKHWVAFFVTIVRPFLIALFGILIVGTLVVVDFLNFTLETANLILWAVVLVLPLKFIIFDILSECIDWIYDEDIVTTERIIDVDQHYLFGKDVGVADLDKVEDISLRHEGILSTLFNFGNIDIRTAGTMAAKPGKTFHMQDAPNPFRIQKIISEAVLSFRDRRYPHERRGGRAPGERLVDVESEGEGGGGGSEGNF